MFKLDRIKEGVLVKGTSKPMGRNHHQIPSRSAFASHSVGLTRCSAR